MKYEHFQNIQIPKIGFGTWKIGGASFAETSQDALSLKALRSAIEIGYTHFDTAEMYANGHSEELLGQAIRESSIPRNKLFITSKISPSNLRYEDVLRSCDNSLRRLGMDYLDLYLIHWPPGSYPLHEAFTALNQLVNGGKIRFIGVSNFGVPLTQQAQTLSDTPLLTNQVPYNLHDRSYVRNSVLDYCRQNGILLTAYSPVNQGRLKVTKTLREIAAAHNATPYQIALAWLVSQPGVITIPMSLNPEHQADNFAAANINLIQDEIERLDQLA